MSLEANRYQLASSEAAASDVTATILLPVSPRKLPSGKQKLHDVYGRAVFQILVWTRLVSNEVLHGYLQSLQSYDLGVPQTMPGHPFQLDLCWTSCHFILHKPNDSVKKPHLKAQPYYGVTVGRHLHLLRDFSLSVRQKLHGYYLNHLQHADLYTYSLL